MSMCKIQTNPGSTQVCVYTTLFQTNPGSTRVEPTSGGGLDLTRVEPVLAVFTRQKLTRVSLCRVNRAIVIYPSIVKSYNTYQEKSEIIPEYLRNLLKHV